MENDEFWKNRKYRAPQRLAPKVEDLPPILQVVIMKAPFLDTFETSFTCGGSPRSRPSKNGTILSNQSYRRQSRRKRNKFYWTIKALLILARKDYGFPYFLVSSRIGTYLSRHYGRILRDSAGSDPITYIELISHIPESVDIKAYCTFIPLVHHPYMFDPRMWIRTRSGLGTAAYREWIDLVKEGTKSAKKFWEHLNLPYSTDLAPHSKVLDCFLNIPRNQHIVLGNVTRIVLTQFFESIVDWELEICRPLDFADDETVDKTTKSLILRLWLVMYCCARTQRKNSSGWKDLRMEVDRALLPQLYLKLEEQQKCENWHNMFCKFLALEKATMTITKISLGKTEYQFPKECIDSRLP